MSKWYKLITIATLALPLPIYLFLTAVLVDIKPDVVIYADTDVLQVIPYEDMYFIYSTLDTQYNGYTLIVDNMIGVLVDDTMIIKTNDDLLQYNGEEFIGVSRLIKQEKSLKLPITFFISILGISIVALVVLGKMKVLWNYPRVATLVSLITGTGILYILNAVIGGILGVFMVATISWAVYCLEYLVNQGIITRAKQREEEAKLLSMLQGKLS